MHSFLLLLLLRLEFGLRSSYAISFFRVDDCHCLDNVVPNRFILIGKFTFPGRVMYSGVVLGQTFVGVLCQVTKLESGVVLVFSWQEVFV